jgi:hypothetical protein
MEAIRRMEPAWEKVQGLKFELSSRIYNLPNGGTKVVPCYVLTKTECLYIATKFNDEAYQCEQEETIKEIPNLFCSSLTYS